MVKCRADHCNEPKLQAEVRRGQSCGGSLFRRDNDETCNLRRRRKPQGHAQIRKVQRALSRAGQLVTARSAVGTVAGAESFLPCPPPF